MDNGFILVGNQHFDIIYFILLKKERKKKKKIFKAIRNGVLNQAISTQIRFVKRITYREPSHFTG